MARLTAMKIHLKRRPTDRSLINETDFARVELEFDDGSNLAYNVEDYFADQQSILNFRASLKGKGAQELALADGGILIQVPPTNIPRAVRARTGLR